MISTVWLERHDVTQIIVCPEYDRVSPIDDYA